MALEPVTCRPCESSIDDGVLEASVEYYQMRPTASCPSSTWNPFRWWGFAEHEDAQRTRGQPCRTPRPTPHVWHSWQRYRTGEGRTKCEAQDSSTHSPTMWQHQRVDQSWCSLHPSWSKRLFRARMETRCWAESWWVSRNSERYVVRKMERKQGEGCRACLSHTRECANRGEEHPNECLHQQLVKTPKPLDPWEHRKWSAKKRQGEREQIDQPCGHWGRWVWHSWSLNDVAQSPWMSTETTTQQKRAELRGRIVESSWLSPGMIRPPAVWTTSWPSSSIWTHRFLRLPPDGKKKSPTTSLTTVGLEMTNSRLSLSKKLWMP